TGTLYIVNSTINGNRASGSVQSGGTGGGIFNGGALGINNSTISGNLADGIGVFIGGGGITNGGGNILIQNSTITGNAAEGPSSPGFGGNIFMAEGTLEIGNTILNAASGGNIVSFGSPGKIISDGYNLSSDNGANYLSAAGDQVNTDPKLGPLQDNGGPTFTHALLPDSPAIDAGNPNYDPKNFQSPLMYDQRGFGFYRTKRGRRDIGAFEVQEPHVARIRPTPPPTPTPSSTPRPSPTPSPLPTPTPSPSPTPTPSPSPTATPSPTTPPPTSTPDPREIAIAKIRRDIGFTRKAVHELNGTRSVPPSVFAWLKLRLRVLKARLAYPLDEELAQIDQRLLNHGPLSEAAKRNLLARLNARLNALHGGG
ncbi:MAG: hypothetical protein DME65_14505, partial [Verrucomicrobia bacterium]